MTDEQVLQINDPNYFVCRLQIEHCEPLQRLFEECANYAMIVDGEGVSTTAAQDLFQSAPPVDHSPTSSCTGSWIERGIWLACWKECAITRKKQPGGSDCCCCPPRFGDLVLGERWSRAFRNTYGQSTAHPSCSGSWRRIGQPFYFGSDWDSSWCAGVSRAHLGRRSKRLP